MKTISLQVPDHVDENRVKLELAAYLFASGILSSGQAAEMLAISKRAFLESVGQFNISIFGENTDDLQKILHG